MSTPLRLTQHGPNVTEIESGNVSVLFSYRTPVAFHVAGSGFFRSEVKHSPTTSKHVNRWLNDNGSGSATEVPQSECDGIALKVTR